MHLSAAMLLLVLPALITIFLSWWLAAHSSGGGEAINVAGSLRKQAFLMAATALAPPPVVPGSQPTLTEVVREFERRLYSPQLQQNTDPASTVQVGWNQVDLAWRSEIYPLIQESQQLQKNPQLLPVIHHFVAQIDDYVKLLEAEHEAKLARLAQLQGLALVVMALVIVLTLAWLFRRITSPLLEMAHVATLVQNGQLQARVQRHGAGEIGQLGELMNRMIADLASHYLQLEERVIEKTRELEQNRRTLELLYRIKELLSDEEPSEAVFDAVLSEVRTLIDFDSAAICLTDRENVEQAFRISSAQQSERTCLASDCQRCITGQPTDPQRPIFKLNEGRVQYGILPIHLHQGQVLQDWQQQLLQAVARNLGTALANSRRKQEQGRLAVLEERAVIARELHDSLAQALSYLKIQVSRLSASLPAPSADTVATLSELREGLNAAYRQLRELLNTFRLQMNERGLLAALEDTVDEFIQRIGIPVRLDHRLLGVELAAQEEIHVLQIVREALANVERHAQASHAEISLQWQAPHIVVTIDDDGIGLPINPGKQHHYGLIIMQDRASNLHGQLHLQGSPLGGTRIRLEFTPITPFARQDAGSSQGLHKEYRSE
ncbi:MULTISPECIES: histidine kinase [Chitinibacter]|uniref:histidine kinase n=1 Tax=Chitinibacter TaxID=230666 RepID=UPI000645FCDC|nr:MULTISPECIES: histidine kinase [Chitinibacter]